MKEEIVAGLRNAIEHGDSLEGASRTFINAGYNQYEVEAAARIVSSNGGVSNIVYARDDAPKNYSPQKERQNEMF